MLKDEHQHELVAHERGGRISILGDIPSKPSGDGSEQLTLGGLAGAARMWDQMISRGSFYACGHIQLVFRGKN